MPANDRIHQVHQELGDVVDDPCMAARLPHALLDRLKALRGMLLEAMNTNAQRTQTAVCLQPNYRASQMRSGYSLSRIIP